jgi:NAD(P)-dependent dehydrogenase (short-subunit alcohol dehydrogenase family)
MDPAGRTFLITGSTDGHGLALARRLAADGGTVLLHGREPDRLDLVRKEIAATAANEPHAYLADLASLDEVRGLAAEVTAANDRIDVLVNNAGVAMLERHLSRDGHELDFAVNYLAHYLLTLELLPLLEAGSAPRIVNVASIGQMAIDFDDVMLERGFDPGRAYCQSKLAQIMFTIDLADRLGASPTVNALHPATFMDTKLVRGIHQEARNTVEHGMEATLRLAVGDDVAATTGRFFDEHQEAEPDPQAGDADARRRLRELSRRLTGASMPG